MGKNRFFLSAGLVLGYVMAVSQAWGSDFLTREEKKVILSEVDRICGDTWCEGDYNFHFKSIACSKSRQSCTIAFGMIDGNGSRSGFKMLSQTPQFVSKVSNEHQVACTIGNVVQTSDLLQTLRPGVYELNQRFYQVLTDCIDSLESGLQRH